MTETSGSARARGGRFGAVLAALLCLGLGAAKAQDGAAAHVYDVSVGGALVGEIGMTVVPGAGGATTRGYAKIGTAVDLTDALEAAADGSAVSYHLTGSVQGVPVTLDVDFSQTAADFAIDQGGRKQVLTLPLTGPVSVLDNNLIDGYQVMVDRVMADRAAGDREFAIIVPQVAALGTLTLEAPVADTTVTAAGGVPSAWRLDGKLVVGPQTIAVTLHLDEQGVILVAASEPGNVRMERRAPGEPVAQTHAVEDALEAAAACLVERDVSVASAGATLAGKLTLPRAAVEAGRAAPTLLLLPGSGAVDLDGNAPPLLVNQGYRQLAYALACRGFGVLRASKLGIPPSTGDANAVTIDTYARNAADWFAFLRAEPGVDAGRLGLIGHSEGGLVALYAANRGVVAPWALVLVAAPGRPLQDLLREQVLGGQVAAGASPTQLAEVDARLREVVDAVMASEGTHLQLTPELRANPLAGMFVNAAGLLRSEFAVSPAAEARGVTAPVGIFQGEKDLQVTVLDATLLAAAAPHAELHLYPDLTHDLVETDGPARSAALPGPDALVSTRLTSDIADFLTRHLARGG